MCRGKVRSGRTGKIGNLDRRTLCQHLDRPELWTGQSGFMLGFLGMFIDDLKNTPQIIENTGNQNLCCFHESLSKTTLKLYRCFFQQMRDRNFFIYYSYVRRHTQLDSVSYADYDQKKKQTSFKSPVHPAVLLLFQ